ncbi:hypothetical protein ACT4UT_06095, partial [Bacillus sp. B-TM1]
WYSIFIVNNLICIFVSFYYFLKSSEGKAFLRGTGQNSSRKPQEVNGIKMYKQYFWLRGDFMVSLLDKKDFI